MSDRIIEMLRHHANNAHSLEIRAHCAEMLAEVDPVAVGDTLARQPGAEAVQAEEPASDAKPLFPAILIVLACSLLGLALIGLALFAFVKGWL